MWLRWSEGGGQWEGVERGQETGPGRSFGDFRDFGFVPEDPRCQGSGGRSDPPGCHEQCGLWGQRRKQGDQ